MSKGFTFSVAEPISSKAPALRDRITAPSRSLTAPPSLETMFSPSNTGFTIIAS